MEVTNLVQYTGCFLLVLHYLNLRKALSLKNDTPILSHYLAYYFSFAALLLPVFYLSLYYLNSECQPVIYFCAVLAAIGQCAWVLVFLLRAAHSHMDPRWILFVGIALIGLNIWSVQGVVSQVLPSFSLNNIGPATDLCFPIWADRAVIQRRAWVDSLTNGFLMLCFVSSKVKDTWLFSLIIVIINSVGSTIQAMEELQNYVGIIFIANYSLVITLTVILLSYHQTLRLRSRESEPLLSPSSPASPPPLPVPAATPYTYSPNSNHILNANHNANYNHNPNDANFPNFRV